MTQSANEPAASAMEYGQVVNLFHVAIHGDYFNPYRIECFDGAELLGQVLCQLWLKTQIRVVSETQINMTVLLTFTLLDISFSLGMVERSYRRQRLILSRAENSRPGQNIDR